MVQYSKEHSKKAIKNGVNLHGQITLPMKEIFFSINFTAKEYSYGKINALTKATGKTI
jgi:hypothetical protein